MPCDSITQVSIELKNANLDTLKKALESLGHSVYQDNIELRWRDGSYNKQTEQLLTRTESQAVEIKRTYAAEMVKAKASRFGWRIKQVSQYKYQIQKG